MALQFGVGTLQISATGQTFAIGKLQGVSLTISYEAHQLRGGLELYPTDTKFSDAKIEGSFEFTIILSAVTNNITGQIKLEKVFCPSISLDFGRTDYTIPSCNFICEAETGGNVMTW